MRTLSILLGAFLFIFSSFSPPVKGYTYKSTTEKISATFPSEYAVSDTEGDTYVTTQITSTLDGQSYMVSYTVHQTELKNDINLKQISLDAFSNAIGADIKSQEKWTSKNGWEGIKAEMFNTESPALINYIVVFNDNIQYQFAVYAIDEAYDEKKAKAFFKTIRLQ